MPKWAISGQSIKQRELYLHLLAMDAQPIPRHVRPLVYNQKSRGSRRISATTIEQESLG